jgi:hypothetical protein
MPGTNFRERSAFSPAAFDDHGAQVRGQPAKIAVNLADEHLHARLTDVIVLLHDARKLGAAANHMQIRLADAAWDRNA